MDNKITLTADYYNIDTEDLLLDNLLIPDYLGFQDPGSANIGEINNRGLEFTLSTRNISNDNFSWSTDFNWSRNQNEVVSLVAGLDIEENATPSFASVSDTTHILREGEAVGVFFGTEFRGVFDGTPDSTKTEEESILDSIELFPN